MRDAHIVKNMRNPHIVDGFVMEKLTMSQDSLRLPSPKANSVCAGMSFLCPVQYGYIGFRFLRYKFSPWCTLAIASLKLLFSSGVQHTHEKICYMKALCKIDFVGVYGLLNELLW
jgi:hypothetical protein